MLNTHNVQLFSTLSIIISQVTDGKYAFAGILFYHFIILKNLFVILFYY